MLVLRKLIAVRDADEKLPGEVRTALVDSLYGPMASLVAGAITGGVIGAMVSLRSGDIWIALCSVAIFACGLARVVSASSYSRRPDRHSLEASRHWERVYAAFAWTYSGLLGLQCALALHLTNDPAIQFGVATMTSCYAVGITGRNAGRVYVAVGQLICAMLPLSIALITHAGWMYQSMGVLLFLFIFVMIETALSIREIVVDALLTTRDKAELAARFEEQAKRFDVALTNMPHGLCMFDRDNRLAVWNERFLEITGLPAEGIRVGATIHDLVVLSVQSGNHSGATARRLVGSLARQRAAGVSGQAEGTLADGRTISLSQRSMAEGGSVVIVEDITERKQAESTLARLARYDELTGLANRTTFHEHLEDVLGDTRMGAVKLAIHWIDLDRFKTVNDTLGHPVGDSLLKAVAGRLQKAVRDGDLVARFGGDEFVVLQSPIRKSDDATRLARRIMEALVTPFQVDNHEVDIGASIGIALAPRDGVDADRLLKSADLALYRAKADGRSAYRFFEIDMDAGAQARRALELDLRRAFERGEFDIHYQPLVDLLSERIVGCEALVRWNHPTRGMVSPMEFIPIAEETGLIVPLSEWVLQRACAEATHWPSYMHLAVNLSPVQFKHRNLAATVVGALAKSGLLASRLELEVTEMVLLNETELTVSTMAQLRQLGVQLSLDDFGTGYSSLSYLRKFPFQKIKLDRSFVKDLGRDAGSAAIVRAVSSLGADLGMTILVEGIETAEQLERVKAEGCTEGQGYLFGRPVPAAEIRTVLAGGIAVQRLVA